MSKLHAFFSNYQSENINQIKRDINKFKYISFDIFDTLIKRDVPEPTDLFNVVGNRLDLKDFKNKRIEAEIAARLKSESGEVDIYDIYEEMDLTNAERKKAIECEIECEINLSCINKQLLPIYYGCIKNKKVVLTTDMYLPRSVIEKILEKNNIKGFHSLYISNELKLSKSNGKLYDYVCSDLNIIAAELLHIGNSFKADYMIPRKRGIKAIKISTNTKRTNRKYSNLLCKENKKKKYFDSFINNHSPINGNPYVDFGYESFGPLLFGFVCWLHDYIVRDKYEQLMFLSRDGFIIRKVYDLVFPTEKINNYYFEASRRSLRVPTYNNEMCYEDYLASLTVPNITNITQILDSWGLSYEQCSSTIEKVGIERSEPLKRDKLASNSKVRQIFDELKNDIVSNASEEYHFLKLYLNQYDFSKKTAIVDIGWGGSMQI